MNAYSIGEPDLEGPWRARAKCYKERNNIDLLRAFVDDNEDDFSEYCRKLCIEACPVRKLCLMDALADPEAEGIRAGYHFYQGRVSKDDRDAMLQRFQGLRKSQIRVKNARKWSTFNDDWQDL
jgi:hypothetical protein